MANPVDLDYKSKPIDENFFTDTANYPITGQHNGHDVRAEGKHRLDADGKEYPTALGIHGTNVAVDQDACIGDGSCLDACPVTLFEWLLQPGVTKGAGNDKKIEKGSDEWNKYRTDKADPVREADCIFCMACVNVCPVHAISVAQRK